jgi:hypothetical protein
LPAAGDTSYSIVVGDTSPIKAVDGSNLNIGTCTMGTTTVNIAYGKCIFPITTVALTAGQVIPAGTVTISDGGSPRAITGTVDYVSYTVGQQANVNPTISITSPTNGVKVALGSTVQISATAADSDGTISKVQFYLGNTLLGEDTTSPYTYSWTPTGLAAGIYSITAKATDSSSGVTTSSAVNVTITTPLSTADDIKILTVKCDDTLISTNTKCSFTMPDYRTLPDGFQIVIGDGSSSGTCTLDVATNLVTCNSVSAGSVAGKLPIYIKIGSGAKLDTGETVNITLPLSVTVRTGGQAVIAVVVVAVTFGLGLSIFFIRRRKLKIF